MRFRSAVVLGVLFVSVFTCGILFAQETAVPSAQPKTETSNEPQLQWVPADVVSVNPLKNELTVEYLDYETDQQKSMVVGVDEKTVFENVKSLAEIKEKDPVSIDYIETPEGKNIARNLSVEREGFQEPKSSGTPETEEIEEPAQVEEGESGGADVSESSDESVE